MQNKPNFQKTQMNVSIFSKMAYENKSNWTLGENKPNSNPIKANSRKAQTSANVFAAKVYENKPPMGDSKKQTQNKPNFLKDKTNATLFAAKDYEN